MLVQVQAQQDTVSKIPGRYRISFTDKKNSPYSVDNPQAFLSQKAIERRAIFSWVVLMRHYAFRYNRFAISSYV